MSQLPCQSSRFSSTLISFWKWSVQCNRIHCVYFLNQSILICFIVCRNGSDSLDPPPPVQVWNCHVPFIFIYSVILTRVRIWQWLLCKNQCHTAIIFTRVGFSFVLYFSHHPRDTKTGIEASSTKPVPLLFVRFFPMINNYTCEYSSLATVIKECKIYLVKVFNTP